jgi:hypothetical protein
LGRRVAQDVSAQGLELPYLGFRADKKRSLTRKMMAEQLGVAKSTSLKIEKGDPTVAKGGYAMAFFVLGFDGALGKIDAKRDEQGLQLFAEGMPKRVRVRKVLSWGR